MENKTRLQFLADQYSQAVDAGYTGTFEDFLGLSNRDEFSRVWALTALRSIVMDGEEKDGVGRILASDGGSDELGLST